MCMSGDVTTETSQVKDSAVLCMAFVLRLCWSGHLSWCAADEQSCLGLQNLRHASLLRASRPPVPINAAHPWFCTSTTRCIYIHTCVVIPEYIRYAYADIQCMTMTTGMRTSYLGLPARSFSTGLQPHLRSTWTLSCFKPSSTQPALHYSTFSPASQSCRWTS